MSNDTIRERFEEIARKQNIDISCFQGYSIYSNAETQTLAYWFNHGYQAASTRNDAPQTSREDELVGLIELIKNTANGVPYVNSAWLIAECNAVLEDKK